MQPDKQPDYEVGYGKPPRDTRFKKGQSGNPRGRPSGSKNLKMLLSEALNEPVIVTENGGNRKITKRQAIIKQLVNQSAKANWRAIKILFDMVRDIEAHTQPTSPEARPYVVILPDNHRDFRSTEPQEEVQGEDFAEKYEE